MSATSQHAEQTGMVTFVVPTKNSERTLEACLASIKAQQDADVEVELVVVDNHSTDATQQIAKIYADQLIIAGPERSAQRNLGASAGSGDHVVFIDSDMVVSPHVARDVAATFAHDPALVTLVLPEYAFGEGFWAKCRALEKRLYVGVAEVEAARAFRRHDVLAAGGYDEGMNAHEDWDLPDRIVAQGGGLGRIAAHVDHDEGRIRLAHIFGKKRYYGAATTAYVKDHGSLAMRRLARTSLFSQPRLLLRDPVHAAGLFVLKAVEAAGLLTGALRSRRQD